MDEPGMLRDFANLVRHSCKVSAAKTRGPERHDHVSSRYGFCSDSEPLFPFIWRRGVTLSGCRQIVWRYAPSSSTPPEHAVKAATFVSMLRSTISGVDKYSTNEQGY
jgi:hypothetical protein